MIPIGTPEEANNSEIRMTSENVHLRGLREDFYRLQKEFLLLGEKVSEVYTKCWGIELMLKELLIKKKEKNERSKITATARKKPKLNKLASKDSSGRNQKAKRTLGRKVRKR